MVPTVKVDLLDYKITLQQKRKLSELLTKTVADTLGHTEDRVLIIFTTRSKNDIARGGKLGR